MYRMTLTRKILWVVITLGFRILCDPCQDNMHTVLSLVYVELGPTFGLSKLLILAKIDRPSWNHAPKILLIEQTSPLNHFPVNRNGIKINVQWKKRPNGKRLLSLHLLYVWGHDPSTLVSITLTICTTKIFARMHMFRASMRISSYRILFQDTCRIISRSLFSCFHTCFRAHESCSDSLGFLFSCGIKCRA